MSKNPDNQISPYDWKANTNQYPWAENFNQEQHLNYITPYTSSLPALAQWMVDTGKNVDISNNFNKVQPGDVIFFSEQALDAQDQFFINLRMNYQSITHAAICVNVIPFYDYDSRSEWLSDIYVITTASATQKTLAENYPDQWSQRYPGNDDIVNLKIKTILLGQEDHFTYQPRQGVQTTAYLPAMDTIVCVCRPNLTSSGLTRLELEAQKLGLHTVPENDAQLEIIRRCRVCSDIEWTPAIDYDRPMPLGDTMNNFHYGIYDASVGYYPQEFESSVMIDGKFKAGVTYKGLPWTANRPSDFASQPSSMYKWPAYSGVQTTVHPEQFLSLIASEDAPTYVEDNKVYPIYGWNDPTEFLRFIFGAQSATVDFFDASDVSDYIRFNTQLFNYSDNAWYQHSIDYDDLKLGDIINGFNDRDAVQFGIVTDIIRNELGKVTHVEVTEATRYGLTNPNDIYGQTGNLIRRKMFSLEKLATWFSVMHSAVDGQICVIRYLYPDLKDRVPLNLEFDSQELLLIPLKGNKSLYTITANDVDQDGFYTVPMILNTDLYDYIFVWGGSRGFDNYSIRGTSSENFIKISDLQRDQQNSNIIYVPIKCRYSDQVHNAPENRMACLYLSNFDMTGEDPHLLDYCDHCSIVYLYSPEQLWQNTQLYSTLSVDWTQSTDHFYYCQQPFMDPVSTSEYQGSFYSHYAQECFWPFYYADPNYPNLPDYRLYALGTEFRFIDGENLTPYNYSRTLFSNGSTLLPAGQIAFVHPASGEVILKTLVGGGALKGTFNFDNMTQDPVTEKYTQVLSDIMSYDSGVANIIIELYETQQSEYPIYILPYKHVVPSILGNTWIDSTGSYDHFDFELRYSIFEHKLSLALNASCSRAVVKLYNPSDYIVDSILS